MKKVLRRDAKVDDRDNSALKPLGERSPGMKALEKMLPGMKTLW